MDFDKTINHELIGLLNNNEQENSEGEQLMRPATIKYNIKK